MTMKYGMDPNPTLTEVVDELPPDRSVFVRGIGGMCTTEAIPMYISNQRETVIGIIER